MASKVLYVLSIPETGQTRKTNKEQQNVSSQGVVSGGIGDTHNVSTEAGEQNLVGWFRGRHAKDMAKEFEELFGAQDINEVVLRGENIDVDERGYYNLRDVTTEPLDPRSDKAHRFDGRLIKKGTKHSHWRAIETNPESINNPFSSDNESRFAVPGVATKTRWFNSETIEIESASRASWQEGEYGEMDHYDTDDSSFARPTLLYELPYEHEGYFDVEVWDTNGHDGKRYSTSTDAGFQDVVQWQRVFDLKHEFTGVPVISSTASRLWFDEETPEIEYEVWSGSTWGTPTNGDHEHDDWQLFDFDLTKIAMAEVEAYVEFENTSTGEYFPLEFIHRRGFQNPTWLIPENEDRDLPSGLATYFETDTGSFPVAETANVDPQAEKTLVRREEVRK